MARLSGTSALSATCRGAGSTLVAIAAVDRDALFAAGESDAITYVILSRTRKTRSPRVDPLPIDAAAMLRSEMRERLACSVEAMLTYLRPTIPGLTVEATVALMSMELLHVVETVNGEHLGRLAELARGEV